MENTLSTIWRFCKLSQTLMTLYGMQKTGYGWQVISHVSSAISLSLATGISYPPWIIWRTPATSPLVHSPSAAWIWGDDTATELVYWKLPSPNILPNVKELHVHYYPLKFFSQYSTYHKINWLIWKHITSGHAIHLVKLTTPTHLE